jgi:RNase P/RNase MRP subunit POP5
MQKLKHKSKGHYVPISLDGLTKKISSEVKRLIREKEEGVVKHIRSKVSLNGISMLVFKNKEGKNVTLSYRHDESGTLRFAREEQFLRTIPSSKDVKK